MKKLDISNQRYGRLTAVRQATTEEASNVKDRGTKWFCECDCGNHKVVVPSRLRNGTVKSCGCLKTNPEYKTPERVSLRHLTVSNQYAQYRANAKRGKSVPFDISRDKFEELIFDDCFYCGEKPNRKGHHGRHSDEYLLVNGVDRIDSSKGYTDDNVVTCCSVCNYAKHELTTEAFLTWAKRVADRYTSGAFVSTTCLL